MKYLNRTFVYGLLLLAWLGFGLPTLVSHKSHELPLIGIGVSVLAIYLTARSVIKTLTKKENDNEDNQ